MVEVSQTWQWRVTSDKDNNLNSGYIWNETETKQFHWNKTLFCVCFVSVLFQFYFRCDHCINC